MKDFTIDDVVETPSEFVYLPPGANGEYEIIGALHATGCPPEWFHIVYLLKGGESVVTTVNCISIRRKPAWKPEIGKLYMFSDVADNLGSEVGCLRRLTGYDGGYYLTDDVSWLYCWPIDPDLLGK